MAYLVGSIIGGVAAILLLSLIWERVLMKRAFDDPVKGKLASVLAAWLSGSAIAGWGFADGGSYRWDAFGMYAIPAIIVAAMAYYAGVKLRSQMDA